MDYKKIYQIISNAFICERRILLEEKNDLVYVSDNSFMFYMIPSYMWVFNTDKLVYEQTNLSSIYERLLKENLTDAYETGHFHVLEKDKKKITCVEVADETGSIWVDEKLLKNFDKMHWFRKVPNKSNLPLIVMEENGPAGLVCGRYIT